jgi:hypothetical protein
VFDAALAVARGRAPDAPRPDGERDAPRRDGERDAPRPGGERKGG